MRELCAALFLCASVAGLAWGYTPYVEPVRMAKASRIAKPFDDRIVSPSYPPKVDRALNVTADARPVKTEAFHKPVRAAERKPRPRHARHHKRSRYAAR